MSTIIEIESKAMLDESSYLKLTHNLNSYRQENYYIDDDKFSHRRQFGLRIRIKNNEYELTLKLNNGDSKIEINQIIDKEDFLKFKDNSLFPDGEVRNYLQRLDVNINSLKIFASLITYRVDINYKSSLISIDKNEYMGHTDYEIECEDSSKESSIKNLKKFLKKNMVEYEANHVSKLERVIKAIS